MPWCPHPRQRAAEFRTHLETLADLVGSYAVERFRPNRADSLEMIRFRNLVHQGWKQAQNFAMKAVLDLQDERSELKDTMKRLRRSGDPETARHLEAIDAELAGRVLRVRHAINAIVWIMMREHSHGLRHVKLLSNNLTRENLFRAFSEIDEINKDTHRLAVSTDLSTCVPVGDAVALSPSDDVSAAILEFKSGLVNTECQDLTHEMVLRQCERFIAFSLLDLDTSRHEQIVRMLKQKHAGDQFVCQLQLAAERAVATRAPTLITSNEQHYSKSVVEMAEKLEAGESWAIATVEDCLHLAMYSDVRLAKVFPKWMADMKLAPDPLDYACVTEHCFTRPTLSLPLPHLVTRNLYTGKWILLMQLDVHSWLRERCEQKRIVYRVDRRFRKHQQPPVQELICNPNAISLSRRGALEPVSGDVVRQVLFDFCLPTATLDAAAARLNEKAAQQMAP